MPSMSIPAGSLGKIVLATAGGRMLLALVRLEASEDQVPGDALLTIASSRSRPISRFSMGGPKEKRIHCR